MSGGLTYNRDGTLLSAHGRDGVALFHAAVVASAIRLCMVGITPSRGITLTKALAQATQFTGRTYKRKEAAQALIDLAAHIEAKKATIPTEVRP